MKKTEILELAAKLYDFDKLDDLLRSSVSPATRITITLAHGSNTKSATFKNVEPILDILQEYYDSMYKKLENSGVDLN